MGVDVFGACGRSACDRKYNERAADNCTEAARSNYKCEWC